jgi:hypothetical protein
MTDRASSPTVDKTFSPDELTDLLTRAGEFTVERCRTEYCDPAPPASFCYVSRPQGSARLLSAAEVVRTDGSFRDWINLSPVAVADEMTVLEVDYPDRFTTCLIVGDRAHSPSNRSTFSVQPFPRTGTMEHRSQRSRSHCSSDARANPPLQSDGRVGRCAPSCARR